MSSKYVVVESENLEEEDKFNNDQCVCMEGQAQGPSGQARSSWAVGVTRYVTTCARTLLLCFSRHAKARIHANEQASHVARSYFEARYESWLDVVYKCFRKRSSCWQLR